jgi:hypothetical protein
MTPSISVRWLETLSSAGKANFYLSSLERFGATFHSKILFRKRRICFGEFGDGSALSKLPNNLTFFSFLAVEMFSWGSAAKQSL